MRVTHEASSEFGPKIRERRKALQLTLTELASLVGTSKSHLSDIERGVSTNTSLEMVARISNALGADVVIAAPEKKGDGQPLSYESPFSLKGMPGVGTPPRQHPLAKLVSDMMTSDDIPDHLKRILEGQTKALISTIKEATRRRGRP